MNGKKVFIFGIGLIGGSVSLAIKKEYDVIVTAYDSNEENSKVAKSLGILDYISSDVEKEVQEADLIILATPVREAEKLVKQLQQYRLKKDVIITDVGSTKKAMMEAAKAFATQGVTFIGGHPMAGSHRSGAASAKAHLFENAFYVLTPYEDTNPEQLALLKEWLKGTNAKFMVMDSQEHDEVTGVVSHFPHLVAASLVRQLKSHSVEKESVHRLAAGGFRDITRIASSDPSMWRDITLQNKQVLLELLQGWMDEMNSVKSLLVEGDSSSVYDYFKEAKSFRDDLPIAKKGAIPSFCDLYVDVPDQSGVISHITTILAIEKISLTNIRIIEAREDALGVLRLSFQRDEDREKAKKSLEKCKYETYIIQ